MTYGIYIDEKVTCITWSWKEQTINMSLKVWALHGVENNHLSHVWIDLLKVIQNFNNYVWNRKTKALTNTYLLANGVRKLSLLAESSKHVALICIIFHQPNRANSVLWECILSSSAGRNTTKFLYFIFLLGLKWEN